MKKAVYDVAACQDKATDVARQKYTGIISQYQSCDDTVQNNIMTGAGARLLNRGEGRDAYSWDDNCVVKIANSVAARQENMVEADISKHAPENVKQYLVPVIDSDPKGVYVTMPYAKTDEKARTLYGAADRLNRHLRQLGYECDIHANNIGILDHKPRLLDYGGNILNCVTNELLSDITNIHRSDVISKSDTEILRQMYG